MAVSGGHELISRDTTEAIKAQLGINADLLASQSGGTDSGRAIALRQKQGIVMVQKIFDNLSRTKKLMGKFILSQFSEIYSVESAKKVLGQAYLMRSFGEQGQDPATGQPTMAINEIRLNETIKKVLSDTEIGRYDITIGEAISSETKKMADFQEMQQFAQAFPNLVTPDIILEASNLPPNIKDKILSGIRQAQQAQQQQAQTALSLNSPVIAAKVANNGSGGTNI